MFFKSKTIAITFSETETPAEELEYISKLHVWSNWHFQTSVLKVNQTQPHNGGGHILFLQLIIFFYSTNSWKRKFYKKSL